MGRILILEDELDIAEMYQWILELDGHEVLGIFDNPDQVRRAQLASTPDIIVLDERLSEGSSGTSFLPELRQRFPDAHIILATADPRVVQAKQELEVHEALLKPFSLERLSHQISRLLETEPSSG